MHVLVKIDKYREGQDGTELIISIPGKHIGEQISRKRIRNAEMRFDDGRHISAEQRNKVYATIRDIADYTGYLP